MSRAKRIVRFSFWLNTITLVLLGGFMVVPLSSPWVLVLAVELPGPTRGQRLVSAPPVRGPFGPGILLGR